MTEDDKINHWNLLYGVHSGIPLCCVSEFIVLSSEEIVDRNKDRHERHPQLMGFHSPLGYVPCMVCFAKIVSGIAEPVEIHQCNGDDLRCQMFSKLMVELFGKPLLFDIAYIYKDEQGRRIYVDREGGESTEEVGVDSPTV